MASPALLESDFSQRLGELNIRVLRKGLDRLRITSSFDRMWAFERLTGFLYTRLKGRAALGYAPNLQAPKSFNEKSIHRRLFSRDPIWPVVTDKVEVRNWLERQGLALDVRFPPLLHIVSDVDAFEFRRIRQPVAIKAAWASGLNLFVRDPARQDWDEVRVQLKHWQKAAYFPERLVWAETQMKRVFAVETLYANMPGGLLDDYKFYVFHGRVGMLQMITGRGGDMAYDHFDRDLNRLRHVARRGKKAGNADLSVRVAAMIPIVERIGAHFDFARIDLYLLGEEIMFGEITQCPANGFAAFTPTSFDFELGEKWRYAS